MQHILQHLLQPLAIFFGAAFTVAAATGAGGWLLGAACRDYAVRFVAGAAILSLLIFALCAVGLVYPLVFLAMGAVCLSGLRGGMLGAPKQYRYFLFLAFAAFFVLYFFNAMAPESSPDGSMYHLGLVSRYLRLHGFGPPITWDMYASLSEGVEMLFLFAFAFGKNSAAAMVHFAFGLALAGQMGRYGERVGYPVAGWCAALLVFASPVVGVAGTSAYIDVAVAAIAFTLFNLLELWAEILDGRLLLAAGLVAGFAFAAKYTAWAAIPYAIGFVLWKTRRWREPAIVGAAATLLAAPWLLKNWIWVANPLAPFFNQYFPNPYVTTAFEQDYREYFTHYELTSLWQIPMQVTTHGSMAGLLGPVFLLAPLGLLALRVPVGRRLWLCALVFGANYFGNIGTRFLIPPLPFVALALAIALAGVPRLLLTLALIHALISWPTIMPRYCWPGAWRLVKVPWREALRIRDKAEHYAESRLKNYTVDRLIEQSTEPGSTVFAYRAIPEAYTSRRILVEYESADNQIVGMILRSAFQPIFEPTWRLRFSFPRQRLRGIRVDQTATGRDLWSIHELRLFDGTAEVARSTRWRLTAHPDPWHIQEAFDNSLVTFWRTGEYIHPGMYVAVDFGGRPETADSVLVEAAPDQNGIRLALEGESPAGNWKQLAAAPEIGDTAAPLGLRRAAAEEVKRRGVDYLLLFDDEEDAADYRANAGLWGVREVGQAEGGRLYKLP